MTYTLTVTTDQAQVLSIACEILARLGIGQFRDALAQLPTEQVFPEGWHDDMDRIGWILSRHMINHVDGWRSNLGVHHERVHDNARVAWDLYTLIRHRLAWDRAVAEGVIASADAPRKWPDMMLVSYDDPTHLAAGPRARIDKA